MTGLDLFYYSATIAIWLGILLSLISGILVITILRSIHRVLDKTEKKILKMKNQAIVSILSMLWNIVSREGRC